MRHLCAPNMWEPTDLGTLHCPRCGKHYKVRQVLAIEGGHLDVRYRKARWWEMSPVIEDWIERVRGARRCLTTSSNSSPGPESSTATASHAEPVRVRARRVTDRFFVVWTLVRQVFPSRRTPRR